MFKQILVPLDGSRFSLHALSYAEDIVRHYKARLILLRVIQPATPVLITPVLSVGASINMGTGTASQMEMEAVLRLNEINKKRAEKYMKKKLEEITSRGIKASSYVLIGDPYESIMKFCRKEKVNLVVMTTHGESGLKRAILGSVTDKIVRDPRVPVLVIRPAGRK